MVSALARAQSPSAVTTRPAERARFDPSLPDPKPAPQCKRGSPPPFASSHQPLQLKPSGNALINPSRARKARVDGLGVLAVLPDELILDLLSLLSPRTVFRLQAMSRALFAFSRHQVSWKIYFLSESDGQLQRWDGDWRRTFWAAFCAPEHVVKALYADNDGEGEELDFVMPADNITVPDLYSAIRTSSTSRISAEPR